MPSFNIKSKFDKDVIETLFIQEMLKRNYLASTIIYPSQCHTKEIIDDYLQNVQEVFQIIRSLINKNKVQNALESNVRSDSLKD